MGGGGEMKAAGVRSLLERGGQALARGAWGEARSSFEEALALEETPEALEGLGRACWSLDDGAAATDAHERAYKLYRARGDAHGAARLALLLAEDALLFRGEEAVWNGWIERARRLLAELDPSPEHALLAVREAHRAFSLRSDMRTTRARAAEAAELARRFGMFDIEVLAHAIDGAALVGEGHVAEGMRILDEATAAATSGEMGALELAGLTCCFMISGCERVRDFPRAAQWCERVRVFSERHGLASLLGVCRTHHAMVLIAAGDWTAAEAELVAAAKLLAPRPGQAAEGIARLGELRRRQGRRDEAVRLFDQVAFHPAAQVGRAALALDRGELEAAVRWAERMLRQVPASDRTSRAHGHELAARARAALGDLEGARAALAEVQAIADAVGTDPMRAAAAVAAGCVQLAAGQTGAARASLEDGVDLYERGGLPYEGAEARLLLAEALAASGQDALAREELDKAAEVFERLGAAHPRAPATTVRGRKRAGSVGLTPREAEVLSLVGEGLSDRAIAERLTISEHTVHRHIANIMAKLGVSSRAAAVAHAAKAGLL